MRGSRPSNPDRSMARAQSRRRPVFQGRSGHNTDPPSSVAYCGSGWAVVNSRGSAVLNDDRAFARDFIERHPSRSRPAYATVRTGVSKTGGVPLG
jgi:hypothetical protein